MIKNILSVLIFIIIIQTSYSQTLIEKEVFNTEYKGDIDLYNFVYDTLSGTYCYAYFIEDEKKYFIISNNSMSEKYDVVNVSEAAFDTKGNYYTITANYREDYGIDNYFLIVNGKKEFNFDYIDSYSAAINNNNEYVFIYKQFDKYKIGYYNTENGLRHSESYDLIKAVYNIDVTPPTEEDRGGRSERVDFYRDENGERGFVAIADGKAKLIFGSKEILTDYSDINEVSLIKNKNSELSFIAKKSGRFYETSGGEFVVSGNKEYNPFMFVTPPVLFNEKNEPVYAAGDSLRENVYDNYVVIGNERQQPYMKDNSSEKTPRFGYSITELKIVDGNISYQGSEEVIIPAVKTEANTESYDEYYSRTFLINNGSAVELGYNTGKVFFTQDGQMLYSGISDLKKKEYLLIQSNGVSKIILNKKLTNEIYDYGISPRGEIFYSVQNYQEEGKNNKAESFLYLGEDLLGKYEYLVIQDMNEKASVIKFDSKNNYSYVAGEKIDSVNFSDFVYTNKNKLPVPKTNAGIMNRFNFVNWLFYTKSDKLFYTAEIKTVKDKYEKEMFIDNVSVGKPYDQVGKINYDERNDELKFYGSRGNKIYSVSIRF